MEGKSGGDAAWDEDDDLVNENSDGKENHQGSQAEKAGNREGRWESGKGRCAITGRRVLGGTDGLRRVMV